MIRNDLCVFELTLPGEPTAKARPRVYQGHAITPAKTVNAEARIFTEFRRSYPSVKPLTGPIRFAAEFWMSRRGKPDLDNLLKLAVDALNNIAYVDDQQIVSYDGSGKYEPDQLVPGKRANTYRKRHKGDPYTFWGVKYEPHLTIRIYSIPEYNPNNN